MSFGNCLWPVGRLAVIGAAVAAIGMASPAWAHDPDDDEGDKEGPKVYELRDDDGKVKKFEYKVERADSKGGYLGVQVQDVTRSMMRARNLTSDQGALVNRVDDEGPADDAGIRRGDVIVEVDRQEVGSSGDLIKLMKGFEPGKKVSVVVVREGDRRTFSVELGKRPNDIMVMGPGYRWRGEMPDMEELREHLKGLEGMDPEKMRARVRHLDGDSEEMRSEVEDLRKELSELREELRDLRRELREARDRSGNRSDD
ncbi:MAG TPA: PDZ domain-containing protein [Acidobacteriota bacterium]|nr:PDZ domain-containing protein [Acidobacteriota bacterium]